MIKYLLPFFLIQGTASAQSTHPTLSLELAGDCIIKTGTRFGSFEIGGLSALAYSKKTSSLTALSDLKNQTDAQLFFFKFPFKKDLCPVPYQALILGQKNEKQEWVRAETDGEGLVFDVDGSFIVSSERGLPENTSQTLPRLMVFSDQARLTQELSAPVSFLPAQYSFPPGPEPIEPIIPGLQIQPFKPSPAPSYQKNSNVFKKMVPDILESLYETALFEMWKYQVKNEKKGYEKEIAKLKADYEKEKHRILEHFKEEHEAWRQGHIIKYTGMKHNAGFEALSFDQDSRILSFMNEAPLLQDQAENPGLVRLIRMTLDNGKKPQDVLEYYYQLDPGMRVSEIVDMGKGQLLVLEIRFDFDIRKVFSKIYEINVDPTEGVPSSVFLQKQTKPISKKLVLDLNSIETKLSSNYPRLDNLEGMVRGPILPTGERSLILVSDNNHSENQVTQFLIFKIQQEKR